MFLTFRDPNGVQITWNFGGTSFSMEQNFREKEVQQRRSKGETGMAHAARCLGHVGPARSHLVALMSSIFVSLDASWPKTIYKKGPSAGHKRGAVETRKHEIEAWEIEDWRGKLRRGDAGVISIPLIRLKCIYNFLCSMLVYTPFALCFVTLRGVFIHFPKLTY
jgi:hypothetical protein